MVQKAALRFPALFVIFSLVLVQFPQGAVAQNAPFSPQQLDQLLAPIALYPDALLAQITTASTSPQQILDVDNWLASNQGLSGEQLSEAAQQQGFDPAFIALVQFPTVLQMMAEHIDDYAAIGQAVTTDQASVSASIQRLRAQAYGSGALRTTPQQTVIIQQGPQPIYVIQPANPQVVYVPQYNPTVVYASNAGAASLIGFTLGIGIGALMVNNQPWGWGGWGWNWGGRGIYYNHGPWGGWHGGYRPPNPWFRPRPIVWSSRPGYGGNWRYRPPNYRPPMPVYRPRPVQPGSGNGPVFQPSRPGTPPTARPPQNHPPNQGQPQRPGGVRPTAPGTRPTTNEPQRPPNQGRPTNNQPARPSQPNPGSQRPTQPQPRPAAPSHPEPSRPAPANNRSNPAPQQQTRPAQPGPANPGGDRPRPQ